MVPAELNDRRVRRFLPRLRLYGKTRANQLAAWFGAIDSAQLASAA
jgi:hypothetical protein